MLAPLPLRGIYVLAEDTAQEIEPLTPQEALVELLRHSYGTRLLQTIGAPSHFLQCTKIVNNVTICSLRRPRSLSALSDLVQLVEEDSATKS
jgi:hypothetical protein